MPYYTGRLRHVDQGQEAMNPFIERMIGAGQLNASVYDAVAKDESATGQAAGVVVLSALAAGFSTLAHAGFGSLIMTTIGALIGWVIWAGIIWFVGNKLLPLPSTHADIGPLMRTVGFASAPGVLRILGIIPGLGGLLFLIVAIWLLITTVVAVRQTLGFDSNGRALAVVVIGWLIQWLVVWLIAGPSVFGAAIGG